MDAQWPMDSLWAFSWRITEPGVLLPAAGFCPVVPVAVPHSRASAAALDLADVAGAVRAECAAGALCEHFSVAFDVAGLCRVLCWFSALQAPVLARVGAWSGAVAACRAQWRG